MTKYALEVNNVSKSFHLPIEQSNGIKQAFVNWTKGVKGYKEQQVLRDISFKVEKGDFFGIVGRNGSGKSTLLKIISQIYTPESGEVKVNGTLIPFIELGVGFNPELTGRENVYLNGALLGFSHEEISVMYDEIVEFAELEEFMDQKLKNYSSGMQVRLAFSIAIKAKCSILVLDEVLAVGDEAFQRKCYQYFAGLRKQKNTVILVTHDMDAVQRFCNKAIMIENGEIINYGNPAEVAQSYREIFLDTNFNKKENTCNNSNYAEVSANIKYTNDKIFIHVEIAPKRDMDDSTLSLFLDRDTGEQAYRFSSDEKTGRTYNFKANKTMSADIELQNIFPNGIFSLRASIKNSDRSREYVSVGNLDSFEVDRRLIKGNSQWDIHWQPNEVYKIDGKLHE